MNLPNKLSLIRIALIPPMVALMHLPGWWVLAAAAVFGAAAITDFLDGHIARKEGLVTNFGKFIDPVADKLLVLSAFVMLCAQGKLPAWMLVAILARELAVDGLRLVVMEQGKVIAAAKLGKIKTVSQIVCILWLMLGDIVGLLIPFIHVLDLPISLWVVVITLWSGWEYFRSSWTYLSDM